MPKKIIFILLVLILSIPLFSYISTATAEEPPVFELTAQERDYLNSIRNQSLTLGLTSELMSFETKNGRFGLLNPFISLLEDEWGLEINIVNYGWKESFSQLNSGELDMVGLAILNEERKKTYYSTEPLYTSTMDVYTRISDPLISITNLDNCTIGLVSGSILTNLLDQYIRTNTKVKYYDNIDDLFTALSNREIDCVISALCAQSELLKYPDITREMDVATVLPSQGLYVKKATLKPLIQLINRYLKSPSGTNLLEDISNARKIAIMEAVRQFYADDIQYLNRHYTDLVVYDSGVLYPFHFTQDDVFEGIQAEANRMFYQLTGMEITVSPASHFSNGFLTALEDIKSGKIIGATGIYYNKAYDDDPAYIYSAPVYKDKLGFYSTKELDSIWGLKIAATRFAAPYVDWKTIAGVEPIIYGDRGEMLKALHDGAIDAIFVSEMSVDYSYTILGDYTSLRAVPFEAQANIHLIAGSEHEVFVRLFNASHLLDQMINPELESKWLDASRNDKYELFRVRDRLQTYQGILIFTAIIIIMVLAVFLLVINRNYHKFSNYDRQISQMLSTQKNADMLWGNTKTRQVKSKGEFPFFKAWGIDIPEPDNSNFFNLFTQSLNYIEEKNLPFYVTETVFTSPSDDTPHYARHYTHKINEEEFMVFALDVTDEKLREESLNKLANTDSLTSLLTRRAMAKELPNLIAENTDSHETLFAMMIDIDYFKKINDTYGHNIGDETLVLVAKTINMIISHALISRWGGEEFLVVVSCLSKKDALQLANHMRQAVAEKTISTSEGTVFSVTVSCGIAAINGIHYEKAITLADEALYMAKSEGRNCVRLVESQLTNSR